MKTFTITICVLFILVFPVKSQQTYYYYKGKKIDLAIDPSYVNIRLGGENISTSLSELRKWNLEPVAPAGEIEKGAIARFKTGPARGEVDYTAVANQLKKDAAVNNVFPFVGTPGSKSRGTSDLFYVQLKNLSDTTLLFRLAREKEVTVLRSVAYMPLWYVFSFGSSPCFQNSLEATNYFYETGRFADIDPGFMFDFKPECANDPLFDNLWGLKNTAYPGVDIKACEVWTLTRGAGVNIAVIDQGIQREHRDLAANMHPSSFDSETDPKDSIPSNYDYHDAHGTQVAGVIAAVKDNNLGVVGIAPEAKILGVGNRLKDDNPKLAEELANGFYWAVEHQADIITNSWGENEEGNLHSPLLEDAIQYALTYGRGGKGCVVLFAAGNYSVIEYPARVHDDILCVGAINNKGERAVFSSERHHSSAYGNKLDVVAPGKDIYTTHNNDTIIQTSGTSFATPYVAGVAALILSYNPDLTGRQVRDIIEQTTQKVGNFIYQNRDDRPNGPWFEQVGYGLVDAYAAVKKAHYYVDSTTNFLHGEVFAFPCEREVHIRNITLENGTRLIAGSYKKVKILSSFKAKRGSRVEISRPEIIRNKYIDCMDDDLPLVQY